MTRPCAVLATGLLLAAAGAAGSEGPWTGTCEVKVVECPLMTFEAVREIGGGGNLPGTLSAAQVELLWKAVKEKKARVVLSAEVAATEGQRSEWRSGRTHRYLAEYNVEGDAVASTVGELALGWTVSVLPMPALGGGYVLKASVEHRDLADGKASVATPHGALETPVVEVRSVTSVAKTPARAVSVLGIVPAAGHGAGGGGGAAGAPGQGGVLWTGLTAG